MWEETMIREYNDLYIEFDDTRSPLTFGAFLHVLDANPCGSPDSLYAYKSSNKPYKPYVG